MEIKMLEPKKFTNNFDDIKKYAAGNLEGYALKQIGADRKSYLMISAENQAKGYWTNAWIAILDKDVSNKMYEAGKKRLGDKYEKLKEESKSKSAPNIDQIIPENYDTNPEYKVQGVIRAWDYDEKNPAKNNKCFPHLLSISNGISQSYINTKYYALIMKHFPNTIMTQNYLDFSKELTPISFIDKSSGELKAIVMPVKRGSNSMEDINNSFSPDEFPSTKTRRNK